MILSLPELDAAAAFDVCIVGSGPAGMTLATALHAAGKRVLVLEAGGREYSDRSQEVYRGEVRGDAYHGLDYSRLRYFGGTSNHWAGRCRPLDAVDFEPRAGIDGTGWPIAKRDLDPYGAAAARILEILGGFSDTELPHGMRRLAFQWGDRPVHFGVKYGAAFESATGPALCLEANLTGLEAGQGRVREARVRDFDSNSARVQAEVFVLACGAIENSRLLLHFNAEAGGRLIPEAGALGRYWMEHPDAPIGHAVLADASDIPTTEMYFLGPSEAVLRENGMLNSSVNVRPAPANRSRMRALATDLACRAPRLGDWAYARLGRDLTCDADVRMVWEQAPHRDNRITLSDTERDHFGIPRTVLHLSGTQQDRRTVRAAALHYGEWLARTGRGRLLLSDWLRAEDAAPEFPEDWLMKQYHQMGGTRMSARAGDGVVDPNLKVWGQDNLYVVGSSVFPTGGHANPTYTIVQLSLRLADHLEQRF